MRKFLRAIGRGLEAVAFNDVFFWIIMFLGTLGGTVAFCKHFNVRPLTLVGGLYELASVAISYALFFVISIIFTAISDRFSRL